MKFTQLHKSEQSFSSQQRVVAYISDVFLSQTLDTKDLRSRDLHHRALIFIKVDLNLDMEPCYYI